MPILNEAFIPISTAPAEEPAIIERNALGWESQHFQDLAMGRSRITLAFLSVAVFAMERLVWEGAAPESLSPREIRASVLGPLAPNLFQSIIKLPLLKCFPNKQSTMISLRSFSRALPRSMPRIAAQCQCRNYLTARSSPLLRQTLKAVSLPRYAAFSTSRAVREKEGQGMISQILMELRSLEDVQWIRSSQPRSSPSCRWRKR